MRIEHAALYVNDLLQARDFFVTYFDAKVDATYHNMTTDFRSCFLRFDDGARLELMHRPSMEDTPKSPVRTGFAHLAFGVGSRLQVDALTARLQADGYRIVSGPRVTGDGYYESCIEDAEHNLIEITE